MRKLAGGQPQPLVIQRPRGASSGNADRSETQEADPKLREPSPATPPWTNSPPPASASRNQA